MYAIEIKEEVEEGLKRILSEISGVCVSDINADTILNGKSEVKFSLLIDRMEEEIGIIDDELVNHVQGLLFSNSQISFKKVCEVICEFLGDFEV